MPHVIPGRGPQRPAPTPPAPALVAPVVTPPAPEPAAPAPAPRRVVPGRPVAPVPRPATPAVVTTAAAPVPRPVAAPVAAAVPLAPSTLAEDLAAMLSHRVAPPRPPRGWRYDDKIGWEFWADLPGMMSPWDALEMPGGMPDEKWYGYDPYDVATWPVNVLTYNEARALDVPFPGDREWTPETGWRTFSVERTWVKE